MSQADRQRARRNGADRALELRREQVRRTQRLDQLGARIAHRLSSGGIIVETGTQSYRLAHAPRSASPHAASKIDGTTAV